YSAAVVAGLADPGVDAIVVVLVPQAMSEPLQTAKAISTVLGREKPVLAAFMVGRPNLIPGGSEATLAGLPIYPSPERAVSTLAAMHSHGEWLKRPPRIVTRFPINRRRVERIINRHRRQGRLFIGEVKAKEIVRAYGFNVPEGYLAATADEAIEAAERIGYPVALKIVCPAIVHKSEVDGVRLNISNLREVRDGFDLLMLRVTQHASSSSIEGVYVEKMVRPGQEVIMGMNRDPQFGPMLMFGLGGIFVETMKDVTFHLAPVTADEAIQMLESTRSYEILRGKRGQKGVDVEAIAVGIQRISQLTTDFPEIIEFEINPYIVSEMGTEPMVADARIILRDQEFCLL
ncbi:MAG: acetate--CoA ligase family protein, partial [Desulfobulbaceae bacterium]|nr:acetate--CoA ligase family protein [Desulfobulbaceae bacterium]